MTDERRSLEYIEDHLDRLQSLARYYQGLMEEARHYHALGNSSELDRRVSGSRTPDAQAFNKARYPDPLAEACRRWLNSLERSLRRTYERMADRNPVNEADQHMRQRVS